MRLLYSAADLMVVPSIQESFGLTASESQACGTPVVAFRNSGIIDLVDHEITGHLATPFDDLSMACSIKWVLENAKEFKLRKNARERAMRLWNPTKIAELYSNIYNKKN